MPSLCRSVHRRCGNILTTGFGVARNGHIVFGRNWPVRMDLCRGENGFDKKTSVQTAGFQTEATGKSSMGVTYAKQLGETCKKFLDSFYKSLHVAYRSAVFAEMALKERLWPRKIRSNFPVS